MNGDSHIKKSKFLSWALRHDPEEIGLCLDSSGWADISELITCAQRHGVRLDRSTILEIAETDSKGRYEVSSDLMRIRATYGHSRPVELGLPPIVPPDRLYHGTATKFLDSILKHGIRPQNRQYVHLSTEPETALTVGGRHGRAVLLTVDARSMHADGLEFFQSSRGIWLTRMVPAQYVVVTDGL